MPTYHPMHALTNEDFAIRCRVSLPLSSSICDRASDDSGCLLTILCHEMRGSVVDAVRMTVEFAHYHESEANQDAIY